MRRETLWQSAFVVLAGFCVGAGISTIINSSSGGLLWGLGMIVLGGLAASVEIPIRPHGALNLSPIVFLVSTAVFDLSLAVVVAGLAPILAHIPLFRGTDLKDGVGPSLATGGEAAVSLLAATVLSTFFPPGTGLVIKLGVVSLLTLGISILLQSLRIGLSEGIQSRKLVRPVLTSSVVHVFAFTASTLLIWGTSLLVGPLGVALSTILVIELYYPSKLLGEQRDLFLKSLQMISNAVDLKDPYTAHHSRRVSSYSVRMARVLGVPEEEVERIRIGALMHDIGKIGVPGKIIRKPAKLTDDEMSVMMRHVDAGTSIVEGLDILNLSAEIVRFHHENFDGTGYPAGLSGKDIPLGARIVFVADAFDALTTDRPYRRGRPYNEALAILEASAGTQFDPDVVNALKKILQPLP